MVYPTEWITAWTVATRAIQRWKLLYVPKSHPVSHSARLLRIPKSQMMGKLAKDMMPVLSEMCRSHWVVSSGKLGSARVSFDTVTH